MTDASFIPPIPKELEDQLKDKQCWWVVTRNPDWQPDKGMKKYNGVISRNDESKHLTLPQALLRLTNKNKILFLSGVIANKYLEKYLDLLDIDPYTEGFKDTVLNWVSKDTWTGRSPGQGYHSLWFRNKTDIMHKRPETNGNSLYEDYYISFGVGEANNLAINNTPAIMVISASSIKPPASKGESTLLIKSSKYKGNMSVPFVFNKTYTLEEVLENNGCTQQSNGYWKHPDASGSGGIQIKEAESKGREGQQLCRIFHNESMYLISWVVYKNYVDAFELQAWFDNPTKENYHRLAVLKYSKLPQLDQETLEPIEGKTVDDFNEKHKRPKHYIPNELIFPDDEWGRYVRAVMDATMYRANPVASLACALSCMGYIAGGVYTTTDYDSTDTANILVGVSRVGKSQAALGAFRLMPVNSMPNIHKRMARSEEGIQDAYIDCGVKPDLLYFVDEIGILLKDMKKENGGGDRWQSILELLVRGEPELSI